MLSSFRFRPFGRQTLILAGLLCCFAGPAWAEEDAPAEEERESGAGVTINLPGRLGLTGFQDMVDARTPKGLFALRGGVHYDVGVSGQDFDGAIDATRSQEVHDLSVYAGGSVMGLVDVAARIPWSYRRGKNNIQGLANQVDRDHGWADFDFAAKVSLNVWGPITVAPYAHGRFPTGEPQVRDLIEFEWGAAASISLFNHYLSVHGNVAGFNREQGLMAVRFRLGAAFVVWADKLLTLRIYGYGDGIEYEGRPQTDIDVEFGAQAILFEFLSVELGGSVRLLDANFLDDSSKAALRNQNVFDRHYDDEGTWQVHIAVGVVF